MFGMFETARPGRAWGRSGLAAVALGIADMAFLALDQEADPKTLRRIVEAVGAESARAILLED